MSTAALAPPARRPIHPAAWGGALILHLALAVVLLPRGGPPPPPGAPFAVGLMGLGPAAPLSEMAPAETLAGPQPDALAEAVPAAEAFLPADLPTAEPPATAPASLPFVPPELLRPTTEAPAELARATAEDVLAPSQLASAPPTEVPVVAPPAPWLTAPPPPAPVRAAPRTSAAATGASRRPTQSAPARGTAAPAGAGQGEAPATSSAPAPGAEAVRLPPGYAATVSRLLQGALRYPPGARDAGVEGSAVVVFSIARDGTILAPRLQRSSGEQALDSEALAVLRRVSPLPPLPEEVPGQVAAVVVPIAFRLR